jgi:hypothetical protein
VIGGTGANPDLESVSAAAIATSGDRVSVSISATAGTMANAAG